MRERVRGVWISWGLLTPIHDHAIRESCKRSQRTGVQIKLQCLVYRHDEIHFSTKKTGSNTPIQPVKSSVNAVITSSEIPDSIGLMLTY